MMMSGMRVGSIFNGMRQLSSCLYKGVGSEHKEKLFFFRIRYAGKGE